MDEKEPTQLSSLRFGRQRLAAKKWTMPTCWVKKLDSKQLPMGQRHKVMLWARSASMLETRARDNQLDPFSLRSTK